MKTKRTKVQELFSEAGKNLRHEFESIRKTLKHYGERGEELEEILQKFLNDHLPKRYAATSGLVIDHEDNISLQTDVIIYDAINSPIYRKGEKVMIIPNDNVPSVIEVKSKLNKKQLQDAAEKIASVKALKKSPISNVDQPVVRGPLVISKTYGVVFAYESYTSLKTLATNLVEINANYPSDKWIDLVVVLDKGVIGYAAQMPFTNKLQGWFKGPCSDKFSIVPIYVHLIKTELGVYTLNRFFLSLMGQLTFYRKRSALNFESVLGKQLPPSMIITGYQYNTKGLLAFADEYHQNCKFNGPIVNFRLYNSKNKNFIGRIGWIPWQDGAVIEFEGFNPPRQLLNLYFDFAQEKAVLTPIEKTGILLSTVITLRKEQFISITTGLSGDVYTEREK